MISTFLFHAVQSLKIGYIYKYSYKYNEDIHFIGYHSSAPYWSNRNRVRYPAQPCRHARCTPRHGSIMATINLSLPGVLYPTEHSLDFFTALQRGVPTLDSTTVGLSLYFLSCETSNLPEGIPRYPTRGGEERGIEYAFSTECAGRNRIAVCIDDCCER